MLETIDFLDIHILNEQECFNTKNSISDASLLLHPDMQKHVQKPCFTKKNQFVLDVTYKTSTDTLFLF